MAHSKAVEWQETKLAEQDPQVLVVGNSIANTSVIPKTVAKTLGLEADQVSVLWASNATAAAWYLMLQNRVYANGYNPRVVVLCNTLSAMLSTALQGELTRERLEEQMEGPSVVISQKVFGGDSSHPLLLKIDVRRHALREGIIEGLKDSVVGWLFTEAGPEGVRAAGREEADAALTRIFDAEDALDMELHRSVIPVTEAKRVQAEAPTTLSATLLPDIVDLVQRHGGRVVVVRAAIHASVRQEYQVKPDLEREALDFLQQKGVGYVPLQDLDLDDDDYRDTLHLNERGRSRVSALIADALLSMDVLGDVFRPAVPNPLQLVDPPVVHREGQPSLLTPTGVLFTETPSVHRIPLPQLAHLSISPAHPAPGPKWTPPVLLHQDGQPLERIDNRLQIEADGGGKSAYLSGQLLFSPRGESSTAPDPSTLRIGLSPEFPDRVQGLEPVWWLHPGTQAVVSYNRSWDPDWGDMRVDIWAYPHKGLGECEETPMLWVGSTPVALRGDDLLTAHYEGPAPEPWSFRIAVPEHGPDLRLASVELAAARGGALLVLGQDAASVARGPRLELLDSIRQASWQHPPPAIDAPEPTPDGPNGSWRIPLPDLAHLGESQISAAALLAICSPLRLLEDGQPVFTQARRKTFQWRPELTRHYFYDDGELCFLPLEEELPITAGKRYQVDLDPGHICKSATWVYPGDEAVVPIPAWKRRTFGQAPEFLFARVTALRPDKAPGQLILEIRSDGQSEARMILPAWKLDGREHCYRWRPPPDLMGKDASLYIHSRTDDVFFLLKELQLAQRDPDGACATVKEDPGEGGG